MMVCKILIFLLAVFLSSGIASADSDDNWKTFKSEHFIVYYQGAPENFIEDVAARAEEYYGSITEELGFTRYNFWLWDNRAKIYIHDDSRSYQQSSGQPGWSEGSAVPKVKIIRTFVDAGNFLDRVLPHEIGHIIFREFIGFDNYKIPLWLDEGVASYQEKYKFSTSNTIVKNAIGTERFVPLEELSAVNSSAIAGSNSKNAQIFYAEAISVVGYLIKEYGRDEFENFCQQLRDGKSLDEAICSVYNFSNIQELDESWRTFLDR